MHNISKFFLIFVIFSSFANTKAPSFCKGLECPEFNIISSFGKIEIREYKDSNWVSTSMNSDNQDNLRKSGFMKLFNYISGSNDKHLKMEMTAPVLFKVNAATPFSHEEEVYTMSFYLGNKFQKDEQAPVPLEKDVYLQKLESKKYAIISYSGYSNQRDQEENLKTLGSYLIKNEIKFINTYYFYAGYDSPFTFFNRHNEVWVELN